MILSQTCLWFLITRVQLINKASTTMIFKGDLLCSYPAPKLILLNYNCMFCSCRNDPFIILVLVQLLSSRGVSPSFFKWTSFLFAAPCRVWNEGGWSFYAYSQSCKPDSIKDYCSHWHHKGRRVGKNWATLTVFSMSIHPCKSIYGTQMGKMGKSKICPLKNSSQQYSNSPCFF